MIKRLVTAALLIVMAGLSPAFAQGPTAPIDCSGAVTTGGTAQNAFAGSGALQGFTITNIDDSEVLWVSLTGTAAADTAGSFPLAPGTAATFAGPSSFTTPSTFRPNTALSVVAATTGHKFSCMRW